jgi:hypothetical protein
MTISVKRVQWWTGPIEDRAGGLSAALKPLAAAGIDLDFIQAARSPDMRGAGVVCVAPITTVAGARAAEAAGLRPATAVAALRVEGENKAGIGFAMTRVLAAEGISLHGVCAGVQGDRFIAYLEFDSMADANRAADILANADATGRGARRRGETRKHRT